MQMGKLRHALLYGASACIRRDHLERLGKGLGFLPACSLASQVKDALLEVRCQFGCDHVKCRKQGKVSNSHPITCQKQAMH